MSASPEDVIAGALTAVLWNPPGPEIDAAVFLAALRAAGYVVERDWQDISTAPRDGTSVQLFLPESPEDDAAVVIAWSDKGEWVLDGVQGAMTTWLDYRHPTHWRPLPAPPGAAT